MNVWPYARQKQTALTAHRSQVNGKGRLAPVMRLLVGVVLAILGLTELAR